MKNHKNPISREEIGARIKAAIEVSSFRDVETFATFIGRSADTIYKMCQGESVAKFEYLATVALALGITPNEILGFNGDEELLAFQEGMVGALEELGLSEDESLKLVQAVSKGITEPVVRSVDRDSVLRDRGALEARRLHRSKLS